MKKQSLRLLFLGCLAITLLAAAGDADFSLPPENNTLKPGPGVELVTAQCLLCHSADYIGTQPRLTRAVWKAEVLKMQQKYGAPIATNNVDALVEYLTINYGREDAVSKSK
jgi:hypothetical protein